jgi:hypothetical protein
MMNMIIMTIMIIMTKKHANCSNVEDSAIDEEEDVGDDNDNNDHDHDYC